MSLYKKNIQIFEDSNSSVISKLKEPSQFPKLAVEVMEDGRAICENDGALVHIHSAYSVEFEAKKLFSNITQDTNCVVYIGFGAGLLIEHLIKMHPQITSVVVIEPSKELFRLALNTVDLGKYLKKIDTFQFIIEASPEVVGESIDRILTQNIHVAFVESISYRALFKEYVEKVNASIAKHMKMQRGNMITLRNSIYIWMDNCMKNIGVESAPVELIKEIFKDRTIIFVGAGPSLDKNAHLLEQAKGKAVIIAGGSAITALDRKGIKPDLRLAMDAHEREEKILTGIDTSSIPLIHGDFIYHPVLTKYEAQKFTFAGPRTGIINSIYKMCDSNKDFHDAFPSILGVGMGMAVKYGAKRVVFVGQDMSSLPDKYYADGSNTGAYIPKEKTNAKNIYGEPVVTNIVMLNTKNWMEKYIASKSEVEYIYATEGGLGLEGAKNQDLIDCIKTLEDEQERFDIQNEIDMITQSAELDIDVYYNNMKSTIKDVIPIKHELDALYNELKEALDEMHKLVGASSKANYKKLVSKVDRNFKLYLNNQLVRDFLLSVVQILDAYNSRLKTSGTQFEVALSQCEVKELKLRFIKKYLDTFEETVNKMSLEGTSEPKL